MQRLELGRVLICFLSRRHRGGVWAWERERKGKRRTGWLVLVLVLAWLLVRCRLWPPFTWVGGQVVGAGWMDGQWMEMGDGWGWARQRLSQRARPSWDDRGEKKGSGRGREGELSWFPFPPSRNLPLTVSLPSMSKAQNGLDISPLYLPAQCTLSTTLRVLLFRYHPRQICAWPVTATTSTGSFPARRLVLLDHTDAVTAYKYNQTNGELVVNGRASILSAPAARCFCRWIPDRPFPSPGLRPPW